MSVVQLCDRIDAATPGTRAMGLLRLRRQTVLTAMLQANRAMYLDTVNFLGARVPRDDLPNWQDVPYFGGGPAPAAAAAAAATRAGGAPAGSSMSECVQNVPDCSWKRAVACRACAHGGAGGQAVVRGARLRVIVGAWRRAFVRCVRSRGVAVCGL